MKGYRKILIAVNSSTQVVRQGLKLADDERCWVTVVKVVPPADGDLDLTGIKNIGDVLDGGGGETEAQIKEIAKQEGSLIKTRVEVGEAHRKIVEVAEEERCDLIIMGSHRRSWLHRLLGDNVVEKVLSQAPCPVLVVGS
jgi:nucleotide-binding universal stress UspA family protein